MNDSSTSSNPVTVEIVDTQQAIQPLLKTRELSPSVKEIVQMGAPGFDINKAINEALNAVAFEENPSGGAALTVNPTRQQNEYNGLFRSRQSLIPPEYTKMMYSSNDLLFLIVNQLGQRVATFCKPQVSVNEPGYKLILRNPRAFKRLPKEQQERLMQRSAELRDMMYNTGWQAPTDISHRPKLPQFVQEAIKNGSLFGWTHAELIKDQFEKPYCFKLVDSGTIYLPPYNTEVAMKAAQMAYQALAKNHGKNIKDIQILERLSTAPKEFQFVQCIDGIVYTAFEQGRLLFEEFWPSTDVNDAEYPRPPIDSIVRQLSTNNNISTRNNLIFINGRATSGFFVIRAANVQENVLQRMRQQFSANINGVAASFRVPVFSVGPNEDIEFKPLDASGVNTQFEYLSEITSRIIMAAYGIDVSEIPSYGWLSAARPGQAISESDALYNATDNKGTGFRFCLERMQNLLNKILHAFDEEVAEHFRLKFMGLDADNPTKMLARVTQSAQVYSTMDEIRFEMDEDDVPIGGKMPLSPTYLNALPHAFSKNEVAATYGNPAKLTDPTLFYYSDPMYFQNLNLMPELLKNRDMVSGLLSQYLQELGIVFQGRNPGDVVEEMSIQQKMQLFVFIQKSFMLGLLAGKGMLNAQTNPQGMVDSEINNAMKNLAEMAPGSDLGAYLTDILSGLKLTE